MKKLRKRIEALNYYCRLCYDMDYKGRSGDSDEYQYVYAMDIYESKDTPRLLTIYNNESSMLMCRLIINKVL